MKKQIIGIDIGGTNIDLGLVDEDGNVEITAQVPALRTKVPEQCIERMAAAAKAMVAEAGKSLSDVVGIGIGSPGPLDIKGGKMVNSPNFPQSWSGYPLREEIARQIGLPAAIDNDANAAALAEGWVGAARNSQNFIVLTLGTGVGGGAIADGRIIRGADGYGGELGHVCVHPEGRPCGCGGFGCLEAYASATAFIAQAQEQLENPNGEEWSARRVFDLAKSGDSSAMAIVARAGEALGIAIGSLLNTFNPEMVVLAGRMAQAFPMLEPHIDNAVKAHSYVVTRERAIICASPLVEKAGLIGAASVFAYESKGRN